MHQTESTVPHVLVCGDGWALGEHNVDCTKFLHGGIAQYLRDDGVSVTNLAQGAISNLDMVDRLRTFLNASRPSAVTQIIVFQTDVFRDLEHAIGKKYLAQYEPCGLQSLSQLWSTLIHGFYRALSDLSCRHDVPVYLIGGCGDAPNYTNVGHDYPGCSIVCQSMTNLVLNGHCGTSDPVLSWYRFGNRELMLSLSSLLPADRIPDMRMQAMRGFERMCLLRENPHYFFPDGIHPNRYAHQILYQHLYELDLFEIHRVSQPQSLLHPPNIIDKCVFS